MGTSFINTLGMSTGFVTQIIIGELVDKSWEDRDNATFDKDGNREYNLTDFNFGFIVIHCALVTSLVSLCLIKETNCENILYD